MTRSSSSSYLLLIVLVCASVETMVRKAEADCEKATVGGGCPNVKECVETCRPCYRGVGVVRVYCLAAGGGFPYARCVCSFYKGAPCNPPAPPSCPRPWHGADHVALNKTLLA
ncbi:hypothetical protein ACOSQ2_007986 [Xanthoceras sorbifolium]